MSISVKTIARLAFAVIAGIVAYRLVPAPLAELTRSEFMDEVRAGRLRKIEIQDQDVIIGESTARGAFRTAFDRVRDADLVDNLRSLGIEIWYSESGPGL